MVASPKPFPRLCGACGKTEVRLVPTDYRIEVKHYGELHMKDFEIPTCSVCGTQWMGAEQDKKITEILERTDI